MMQARKAQVRQQTRITDYEFVIGDEKEAKKKANQLIARGMRPWGSPSFIPIDGSITCCQVFVKKETERIKEGSNGNTAKVD